MALANADEWTGEGGVGRVSLHYKDKKVKSMAILTTNGEPELCIEIEEEKINENNM